MTEIIRKRDAVQLTQEMIDGGLDGGMWYAGYQILHCDQGWFIGPRDGEALVPGSYRPFYQDAGYPQIGVYVDDLGHSFYVGQQGLDIRVVSKDAYDFWLVFGRLPDDYHDGWTKPPEEGPPPGTGGTEIPKPPSGGQGTHGTGCAHGTK
jgi:hypothetical protein